MPIIESVTIDTAAATKQLEQLGQAGAGAFGKIGTAAADTSNSLEAVLQNLDKLRDALNNVFGAAGGTPALDVDAVTKAIDQPRTGSSVAEDSAASSSSLGDESKGPVAVEVVNWPKIDATQPKKIDAEVDPTKVAETLVPAHPAPPVIVPPVVVEAAPHVATPDVTPAASHGALHASVGGGEEVDDIGEKASAAKEKLHELGEIGKESLKGTAESIKLVSEALRTLSAGSAIASLRALSQTTGTVASAFGSAGEAAKGFIEGGAAVAATIAGIAIAGGELAKTAAEDVLEMKAISETAGISIERLASLKKVFEEAGVEPEGLAKSFRTLAVRAAEAWPEISKQVRDSADQIEHGSERIREAGRGVEAAQDGQREAALKTASAEEGVAAAHEHTQTAALDAEDAKLNLSKAQQRLNVVNYGHEDRGLNEVIKLQEEQKVRRDFERAQLDVEQKERASRDAPLGEERAQLTLRAAQRDEAGAGDKTAGAMLDLRAAINGLRDSLTANVATISEALKGNNPQGIDLANVDPQKLFETAIFNAGRGANGLQQVAAISDVYKALPQQQQDALGRASFGPSYRRDNFGKLLDEGGDRILEEADKPSPFGRTLQENAVSALDVRKRELEVGSQLHKQRDLTGIDLFPTYGKGLQATADALPGLGNAIRGAGEGVSAFVSKLSDGADAAAAALRRLADSATLVPHDTTPAPASPDKPQGQSQQQTASPDTSEPATTNAAGPTSPPTPPDRAPTLPAPPSVPPTVIDPNIVVPGTKVEPPPPAKPPVKGALGAAIEGAADYIGSSIIGSARADEFSPERQPEASGSSTLEVIGEGALTVAGAKVAKGALGLGKKALGAAPTEIPRFLESAAAPAAEAATAVAAPEVAAKAIPEAAAAAATGEIPFTPWAPFLGRIASGVGAVAGISNLPGAIDAVTDPNIRSERAKANDEAVTRALEGFATSVKSFGDSLTALSAAPGADIGRSAAEELAGRDFAERNRNAPEDLPEAKRAAALSSLSGRDAPTTGAVPLSPAALAARDAPFEAQSIAEGFAPKTDALTKAVTANTESTKKLTERQEHAAKEGAAPSEEAAAGESASAPKTKRVLINGKAVTVPVAPAAGSVDNSSVGGPGLANLGTLGGDDPGAQAAWAKHPDPGVVDLTPGAGSPSSRAATGADASSIRSVFEKTLGPLPSGTSFAEDGNVLRAQEPSGVQHTTPRPEVMPSGDAASAPSAPFPDAFRGESASLSPTPFGGLPRALNDPSPIERRFADNAPIMAPIEAPRPLAPPFEPPAPPPREPSLSRTAPALPDNSIPWNASPRNDGVPGRPGNVVGGRDWNSGWFPGQIGIGGAAAFFGGPSQRVRYNPVTNKPELVSAKGTTGGVDMGGPVYERGTEGVGNIHISNQEEPLWGDAATWRNYERNSVSAGPTTSQDWWDRRHPEDNPRAALYATGGYVGAVPGFAEGGYVGTDDDGNRIHRSTGISHTDAALSRTQSQVGGIADEVSSGLRAQMPSFGIGSGGISHTDEALRRTQSQVGGIAGEVSVGLSAQTPSFGVGARGISHTADALKRTQSQVGGVADEVLEGLRVQTPYFAEGGLVGQPGYADGGPVTDASIDNLDPKVRAFIQTHKAANEWDAIRAKGPVEDTGPDVRGHRLMPGSDYGSSPDAFADRLADSRAGGWGQTGTEDYSHATKLDHWQFRNKALNRSPEEAAKDFPDLGRIRDDISYRVDDVERHEGGGHIRGPGTGTSDSIPARLSNGEYVVKADRVADVGVSFMDRLNAGKLEPADFTRMFSRGGVAKIDLGPAFRRHDDKGYASGGLVSNFDNSSNSISIITPAQINAGIASSMDTRAFADGGLASAIGEGGSNGRGDSLHPVHLTIEGQKFDPMLAPPAVAEALSRWSMDRKIARSGPSQSWVGG